jgi:hypothetical protein
VIVGAGLLFIFFPIWYGPMRKVSRALRRRMSPEQKTVELEPLPA